MTNPKFTTRSTGDIYRHIFLNQVSSRQKIAETLGISLPTVSQKLTQLNKRGLIYNVGEFESTGGRKANMISYVSDARLAIGIDITKTFIVFVLVDLSLNLLENRKFYIPYEATPTYYSMISAQIEDILECHQVNRESFLGVGISLPAIVDTEKSLVKQAEIIDIPDDFYEQLKNKIPYPCRLFNDANSAGWTEIWQRNDNHTMVYLSLSNTVGGALIMNNQVYTGEHYRGAEFGHMTVMPHGKQCYCGKYGCLDAYCSAHALSDFTNGNLNEFFIQLKNNQNRGFQSVFHQYLEHLATAVNNLRMCFDCNVVLGGNVGTYMEDYLPELRKIVSTLSAFEHNADYLKVCSYRTEPSAVGAALYFVDEFVRNFS